MNPGTGHLVDLTKHPEYRDAPGYEPVPEHLHAEAVRRLELAEAKRWEGEAWIPKRSRTPLGKHAAARRKARKKAAKLARKRQRGKP
jgi:hypothetical protein